MAELERVLDQIAALLETGSSVAARMSSLGPDQVMVWDWIRMGLARRFADLTAHPLHVRSAASRDRTAPRGRGYRLARAGAAPAGAIAIDLVEPSSEDLITVLLARRQEMIRHHGLIITRSMQRAALDWASRGTQPRGTRLCRANDLIDQAVLAYRQSLLALARTLDEADAITTAFAGIAFAIERAGERVARPPFEANAAGGPRNLVKAIQAFQAVIGGLGGPGRAAIVPRAALDAYIRATL
jgi:hypothetical protein